MRQRNTGAHPLAVPSLSVEVLPGEVIDYPDPITGLEPVDDDDTVPEDAIRQVRDQGEPAAAEEHPPDPEPATDPDPKPLAAGGKTGRKPRNTPATTTEEA